MPLIPTQLTAAEQAEFESKASGPKPIDLVADLSAAELAELSIARPGDFDPVQWATQRGQEALEPVRLQKLADANAIIRQRGFELSDLPTPAQAAGGVLDMVKGGIKYARNIGSIVTAPLVGLAGDISGQGPDFGVELADVITKQAGETIAGTEQAVSGLTDLARKGATKAARASGVAQSFGSMTPDQRRESFLAELGRAQAAESTARGQGPFTQAVAGEFIAELKAKGVELDPNEVASLSAGDPISFVTFGKGFQLIGAGGKVLGRATNTTGLQAATEALAQRGLRVTAGKALEATGSLAELGGKATQLSAKLAPAAGAVVGTVKAGPFGTLAGIAGGKTAERIVRGVGEAAETAGSRIAQAGEQISTGAATSPYVQAAADVLKAAPVFATELVKGAGLDIGLAAVTAETPEETKHAAAFGTLFGAAKGAGRAVKIGVQGQLLTPRSWGSTAESKPYGSFAGLDAAHAESTTARAPLEIQRANSVREYLRNNDTQAYLMPDKAATERILTDDYVRRNGVAPTGEALANIQQSAQQRGMYNTALLDDAGVSRRVILLNDAAAAPHEALHPLQDVIGEPANTLLDRVIFEEYAPQWEAQGERYARKLEPASAEPWRDVIKKNTNWENPDQYLARELAADNFDIAFKNQGATFGGGNSLPERLARIAAKTMSFFGAEPFSGAKTELLGIEPRFAVVEAVRSAAAQQKAVGTPPVIVPKAAAGKPVVGTPAAPTVPTSAATGVSADAKSAQEWAAATADQKLIRVVNSIVANQVLSPAGEAAALRLRYRSVAGEAEASRTPRRSEQEAAYLAEALGAMPAETRALVEKTHAHVRFEPVRKGKEFQSIGYSAEKLVANAQRTAKWISEHPEAAGLSPYAIEGKTFSPEAWKQLVSDIQSYTQNQQAGGTGAGRELVRPAGDLNISVPEFRGLESMKPLEQAKADFINMLMGLKLPETTRVSRAGGTPGNVVGQLISEAQPASALVQPRVSAPAVERAAGKEFPGFPGRMIAEVNPLRRQLEAAGLPVGELIEVVERINLKNLESATSAPEVAFRPGVTDTIRAGFAPAAEKPRWVIKGQKGGLKTSGTFEGTDMAAARKAAEAQGIRVASVERTNPIELRTQFAPANEEVRSIAAGYAKARGLETGKGTTFDAPVNESLAKRLADWYDAAETKPNDPAVKQSYDALAAETMEQYRAISEAGYTVEPFTGAGEPYKSSDAMAADIRDNKHLYFLKTEGNFSGGDNALLKPSGVGSLLVNDVFRAVHDFYGHAAEGLQFGPKGEFNAWRVHSEMYSPEAQGALAAETLAQNSWVNFGKHLRKSDGSIPAKGEPEYVAPPERRFAEQKNVIVPPELIAEAKGENSASFESRVRQMDEATDIPSITKNWQGGQTGESFRLGAEIRSPEQVARLHELESKWTQIGLDARKTKNYGVMVNAGVKSQFFREAREAATGEGGSVATIRKFFDPNYEPPMGKTQFSPETTISEVAGLSKESFKDWAETQKGGFTWTAYRLGAESAKSPVLIERLGAQEKAAHERFNAAETAEDFDGMMLASTQSQFFREAREAATGTGSAGEYLSGRQQFSPKEADPYAKYNVDYDAAVAKRAGAKPGAGLTGWILPNNSFEPLTQATHERYLADNSAALNKRFKTAFSKAESVEERAAALTKGFVRMRIYDGVLKVEANQRFWTPKVRKQVRDLVLENIDDVDRMVVNLLNDKNIVTKQGESRLHEYEGAEKLEHLPLINDRGSRTQFAPAWRDNIAETLETWQTRGTPEQLRAHLAKTRGTAEQADWIGLDEYLKDKKTVNKADVQQFVRENQVEIQEVIKGSFKDFSQKDSTRLDELESLRDRTEAQDAERQELITRENAVSEPGKSPAITKYENYQLPGGSNYRELLLTLPEKDTYKENPISWILEDNKAESDYAGRPMMDVTDQTGRVRFTGTPREARNYLDEENMRGERPKRGTTFKSSHFDEPNILAHVRYNERGPMLFIEEIQSDWHKQGREEGYGPSERMRLLEEAKRVEDRLRELAKSEGSRLGTADMDTLYTRNPEAKAAHDRLFEIEYAITKVPVAEGVPDAPYKNTWPMLVMRRMIRQAAEGGFDKLGWITGEQTAARYDLSEHVSHIDLFEGSGGKIILDAYKNDLRVLKHEISSLDEVKNFVGKDVATKLVAQYKTEGAARVAGNDIKVGGKWARNLYDETLVNEVNKFAKKYGVRVERTKIETAADPSNRGSGVYEGAPMPTETVHSITITPEMREAAMQGMMQFSPEGSAAPAPAPAALTIVPRPNYQKEKRHLEL